MKEEIIKAKTGQNLNREEIEHVMHEIMNGTASRDDMTQILLALRDKGPTVDEITGAANMMRKFLVPVKTKHTDILDTCGTGGDKSNTFNISTITAFVVAAAGCVVAKHGNRSVSSKCGSADVLEAMGINLNLYDAHLGECLDEVGIAFLFAQKLHPAMKNVAPVRKELGVETIFNVLGPLTNPASATHQVVGVYNRDLVEPIAHVLENLGLKRALVVHGSDGLDEITTTGKTFIGEFDGHEVITYDVDPEEFGVNKVKNKDLEGGDLKRNVEIFESVINGQEGPKQDIVVVNAAYALYTAEKVSTVNEGLELAREVLSTGQVKQKFEQLRDFTQQITA